MCVFARARPWYVSTFIHLADAFIQTDTIEEYNKDTL